MTNIAVSSRYIYHYSFVDNCCAGALKGRQRSGDQPASVLRQLLLFDRRFCVARHQALEPLRVSFKAVKLRSASAGFGLFFVWSSASRFGFSPLIVKLSHTGKRLAELIVS